MVTVSENLKTISNYEKTTILSLYLETLSECKIGFLGVFNRA